MTLEEELVLLRAENETLKRENESLRSQLGETLERLAVALKYIAELEQRIAEREGGQGGTPSFVKSNRAGPQEPKPGRRKRAQEHNHGRHREPPTRTVRHAVDRCPDCGYRLRGESIDYVRQVIELPPSAVEVVEHQVVKRYCPHCQRWVSSKLDLHGQVLGQGRMGIHLISLICYLWHVLRLPVESIQEYLGTIHALRISEGEIVELLHRVRRAVVPTVEGLKREARASPILQGDETGWREDGQNGYIWGIMTPGEAGVRYFEYDHSRGQHVAKRIIGAQYNGCLGTDFYAGYNDIVCKHQRCWAHLLRDLHKLKERHAQERKVVNWAKAVGSLYAQARRWLREKGEPTAGERGEQYAKLVGRARRLGLLYAQVKGHPCQSLAKRIMRHEDELFQFVLLPGVPADNNLAERSLRHLVVIRKISGGSRSDEGTTTRMVLASLFGTWRARGQNPFVQCVNLLSHPPSAPS